MFRNLGNVDKWGIDGSVAYQPIRELTVYAFGSWNKTKIKDNIQIASLTSLGPDVTCDNIDLSIPAMSLRRRAAAPSPRASVNRAHPNTPTASRPSARSVRSIWASPPSGPARASSSTTTRRCSAATWIRRRCRRSASRSFGKTAPAYWLVNLDVRFNLEHLNPQLSQTYFQLNVYNLFDKFYVGGFGGGLNQSINAGTGVWGNPPFVQIGAPRTISGTLNVGF